MKIIYGNEIKKEILEIKPHSVAVAFVGIDWKNYIDISTIKNIILSPTFGSNPRAIEQIVDSIDGNWDSVYFLDELHAKMYIGKKSLAIGSFNLTKNGLDGELLSEVGIVSENKDLLDESINIFGILKIKANLAYPNTQAKKNKLADLIFIWNKASAAGLIKKEKINLREYKPKTDTAFYICWADGSYIEWNEAAIKNNSSSIDLNEKTHVSEFIKDGCSFKKEDNVKKNQWILRWETKKDGSPSFINMKWIYIHDVISDGAIDKNYPQVAVQWENLPPVENEPFHLGPSEKRAIVKTLQKKEFKVFMQNNQDLDWSLNLTFPFFIDFIKDIRNEVTKENM